MVVEPNVGLEITKGVGKVVVQELHGILELVSWWAVIMLATIYVVGTLGGAQGGKGGYQEVEEGLKCWIGICIHLSF